MYYGLIIVTLTQINTAGITTDISIGQHRYTQHQKIIFLKLVYSQLVNLNQTHFQFSLQCL